MTTIETSIEKLGIRTGIVTSIVLTAYFLLMRALNLIEVTELRYLNILILFGGIFYAYRHFRRADQNIPYLPGFGLGMLITAVSTVLFAGFTYIYFAHIEPGLLEALTATGIWFGEYMNPLSMAGVVMMEGLSSGLIISFTMMQYYKSRASKGQYEMNG